MARKYSVYERGTDRPIMIHGTAAECAAAMGVRTNTFYIYVMRQNKGWPQRIEIFMDDPDEEDDADG